MAVNTYYFDASDGGPTDPDSNWINDANATDGSTITTASASTAGSTTSNYLGIDGTNAPTSSDIISQVRLRINWSDTYGNYVVLSEPVGGWSFEKLQGLESRSYEEDFDVHTYVYVDGDSGGVSLGNASTDYGMTNVLSKIEIEVTSEPPPVSFTFTADGVVLSEEEANFFVDVLVVEKREATLNIGAIIGPLYYYLNGVILSRPNSFQRKNLLIGTDVQAISGKSGRDVRSGKEIFTLTWQDMGYTELQALITILEEDTAVEFEVSDGNLVINPTNVIVNMSNISYTTPGSDYLSDVTLQLTEVE